MAPKRHRNFDNRPAAKKARDSAFGMNLNAEEIATLLRERTALKLNVSNNGVKVGGFKNNSRQQKSGREIMTRAAASHNSQQELSVLNGVSDKFDSVLKKTNDLCDRMEEAQSLLQNGRNSERTEVETLSLAQKLLVEDFEQKLLEKDEMRRKLQEELEQQDESYLREIDELKAQIEQSNANRIDPNYVTCSICLEPWNSSGSHRVSALACGHVYGDMCIRVHLNSSQDCPMCRSPADCKDLRYLFLESHSSAAN